MKRLVFPLLVALSFAHHGVASGFYWGPLEFWFGDQGYTIEVATATASATIDIDIVDRDGAFDVVTSMSIRQTGFDLLGNDGVLGGATFGSIVGDPMMMFGSTFWMTPLVVSSEEIVVRDEPLRLGVGTVTMDREEEVAGFRCVVITVTQDSGEQLVYAVADGVPIPCFVRHGSGENAVEVRLIDVRR